MKSVMLLALACAFIIFGESNSSAKPSSNSVIVKTLSEPFPAEKGKGSIFLWSNFANKPEEKKFSTYTTKYWRKNYKSFSASLLKKAGKLKLDTISLRKSLDAVLSDAKGDIAYLPIGAYQTTYNGKPIWIITVKWEYPSMGDENQPAELSHIRVFAFDQETLEQVGFATCG